MQALKTFIAVAWVVFWLYWLLSAFGVKAGRASRRRFPLTGATLIAVIVILRVFRGGTGEVHSLVLGVIGAVVFATGLALALWARGQLGRNWGMPMTQKQDAELITSGPYAWIRHPIYSGLLIALVGTALATNLIGLAVAAVAGVYFYYAASVEERNLTETFPAAYPQYRSRTKMLIPFVL